MPVRPEIVSSAFESEHWRATVDGLTEATGLLINVMDGSAAGVVRASADCSFCDLATRRVNAAAGACFDDPPGFSDAEITPSTCRAGLPCYIAPIKLDGEVACTVIVGGFVSSTRDRKRLFEQLLGKDIGESMARKAVRSIPILARREVEALVRVIASTAEELVTAAAAESGSVSRLSDVEAILDASRDLTERRAMGQDLLDEALARGMQIIGADSGSLMLRRAGTDLLEVVACDGEALSAARGKVVRFGDGIAGRVAASARSLLLAGDDEEMLAHSTNPGRAIATAVSVPLTRDDSVFGVLNLNISDEDRGVTGDDVALVERYAEMVAVAIDNAREHRGTERAMFELMQLEQVSKTIGETSDIDEIVRVCGSVMEKAFDFDIAGVILTGWGMDHATAIVSDIVSRSSLDLALSEAAGRDVAECPFDELRLVQHRGQIVDANGTCPDDWSVLSTELLSRDAVVGYLFVAAGPQRHFDADDRRLLMGLSDHVAIGLERSSMLQRTRDDLARTIAALSATLDVTEHSSRGHSDRVMDYSMLLGEELGLDVESVETLRFAGLLHDVGKTGISEEIILRPSRSEGAAPLRAHSEGAATVVDQIEFLNAIAPVIMHHHERWDGGGHPMGLAGDEIPLLARVLAIADTFDALTSDRPFARRLSFAEARSELQDGSGKQFDPALVDAFLDAMDRRALAGATGLLVEHDADSPQLPA